MATSEPSTTDVSIPMIICPTTHNDWDWQLTFENYYTTAWSGYGVAGILDSVVTIFQETTTPGTDFKFSYAEVGYLRRYLKDNLDKAAVLEAAGERFCLLGGGITSPDNQTCHGEVFIRNYLTGHDFLKGVSLIKNVFPVAWLPDDFGHDPQLPVLIEALGMNSICLSRIPGSPQPTPCPSQPANAYVRENGLSFYWPGNDGSKVLTHFMPATYYGITNYIPNDLMDTKSGIQQFLEYNTDGVYWPGGTIFATQGGDWQFPTSSAPGGTAAGAYNWAAARNVTKITDTTVATSRLGTFADYYNALMQSASDLPSFVLYAENYWTGYFASRPQLKIDHYQATQLLLGAEVLESILVAYGGTTSQEQAELWEAIAKGWHLLVPTSHHDYITGTSPNNVYNVPNPPSDEVWDSSGQLPMSAQAVTLATNALNIGMAQLAKGADISQQNNEEIPVVVFNQIGLDLPDTAMVEMADPSAGATDFMVRVGNSTGPVQRSSDNTLLFQVPGMSSMAYQVVYLVPVGPGTPAMASQTVPHKEFILSNDRVVDLVLSQDDSWAIKHMFVDGKDHVLQDGTYANRIGSWIDSGNLYQFGMEFLNGCGQGTFSFDYFLTGESGQLLEAGPIRWRFVGNLTNGQIKNTETYTTQYDLIRGETLVRITTTGAAPAASTAQPLIGSSLLASFSMQTVAGATASVLEYGTSYYWENRDPQPSWNGLTFRASRDFAQLATGADDAIAAVYHNGIPAWTIDNGILRGCVLRNAPGNQRGANGTDTDPHTQSYTLDVLAQPAVTGYPLRTALYAQTPLYAALVDLYAAATMPEAAQLASVAQSDAVLRVAKTNLPFDGERNLILRVQQARTGAQQLDINLPFPASGGSAAPEIVTALETVPERQPVVKVSGTTASFIADRALWTMKVPIGTSSAAE